MDPEASRRPRRRMAMGAVIVAAATLLLGAASLGDDDDPTPTAAREAPGGPDRGRTPGPRSDGRGDVAPADPWTSTTTTTMPPRALPALEPPTGRGVLDGRVVVVDPGHNGGNAAYAWVRRPASDGDEGPLCNTAGAVSVGGVAEHEINWAVGREVARLLRSVGAAVVVTHADDDGFGPCADERGALAATADADVLVSLHGDGASPSASGFHVIHPAVHPDLSPDATSASKRLADLLRDELVVIGARPADYVGRRGVQERGDLATLNHANRPAVLAELGNLRNPVDAAVLTDPRAQQLLARAVARAVVRFCGAAPAAPQLAPDLDGDGLVDLLPAAPGWLVPTTTTTSSTSTTTSSVPPEAPDPTVTSTIAEAGSASNGASAGGEQPNATGR